MDITRRAIVGTSLAAVFALGACSSSHTTTSSSTSATTPTPVGVSASETPGTLYPEEWYGELTSGSVKGSEFRQYVLEANKGAYDIDFDKQHYNEVHSMAGVVHASARDASGHRTYTAQLQHDGYYGLDGTIHQLRWSDVAPTVMERSGNRWVKADQQFADVYPGDSLRSLWDHTPDGTYNADTHDFTVGKWVVTVPDDNLHITQVKLVGSSANQPEVRSQPTS